MQVKPTVPFKGHSVSKILIWATLFQCAWHFRSITDVLFEGMLVGADDFLRLVHVRDWMNGQSWFDASVHRMGVAHLGDLHWSRIVDLPIAGLIYIFDIFFDRIVAERLTSIIWPLILLLASVAVIVKICSKLFPKSDKLLTLLFVVTCVPAMLEFAPGRIDHHNVQIFLLSLTLLGFAYSESRWGAYLIGGSIAVSILIGLDTLLLTLLILAWIGLEWAFFLDKNGQKMLNSAIGLIGTYLVLYPIFVPFKDYAKVVYDANSVVYLTVYLSIGVSFFVLANLSKKLTSIPTRMIAGSAMAGVALAITVYLFPQFLKGPYEAISVELWNEWLSGIVETNGLIAVAGLMPNMWFCCIGYLLFIGFVGLILVVKNNGNNSKLLAFYVLFIVCAFASFYQMRAMRVGLIASIPICVWATYSIFEYLNTRYKNGQFIAKIIAVASVALLSGASWFAAGSAFETALAYRAVAAIKTEPVLNEAVSKNKVTALDWHQDAVFSPCMKNSYHRRLAGLPKGRILNELDIGPSILVFTHHNIVASNYHRNEKDILDTKRFFNADHEQAGEIAKRLGVKYVSVCQPVPGGSISFTENSLGYALLFGKLPVWLKRRSPVEERLVIFEVIH